MVAVTHQLWNESYTGLTLKSDMFPLTQQHGCNPHSWWPPLLQPGIQGCQCIATVTQCGCIGTEQGIAQYMSEPENFTVGQLHSAISSTGHPWVTGPSP